MSMLTDKMVPFDEWFPVAMLDLVSTVKRAVGETVRDDQLLSKWGFESDTANLSDDDINWLRFAERIP